MELFAIKPLFALSAIQFAFDKATPEGKITILCLAVVSLLSWTVIITKARQLWRARKVARKFFAAYRATRDPLDLHRNQQQFDGAPAFEFVRVAMERVVSAEGMALEKGMIVLSTAVAGGPFIGLLGTVWGVMETFSGVARANAATLTAMAPGVAGALIATVIGLLVAIPAMFAYNFMVTQVRGITQELDDFSSEFSTQLDHTYVDARSAVAEGAASRYPTEEQYDLKTSPETAHIARASLA